MSEVQPEVNSKSVEATQKKKRGRPPKIELPLYFSDPAKDPATLAIQRLDAEHWLLGTGPYHESGKSFSAKMTYVGPRSFMSRQIILAKRSISPQKGNWKPFVGSARLRKDQEYGGNIKDPQFIFEALTSQGGKKNYKLRFVEDAPLAVEKEKERFLTSDRARILALPYRVRKDQVKLGLKPPLNPGEAAIILSELSKEGVPEGINEEDLSKWLKKEIKEEARIQKQQNKQSKK